MKFDNNWNLFILAWEQIAAEVNENGEFCDDLCEHFCSKHGGM